LTGPRAPTHWQTRVLRTGSPVGPRGFVSQHAPGCQLPGRGGGRCFGAVNCALGPHRRPSSVAHGQQAPGVTGMPPPGGGCDGAAAACSDPGVSPGPLSAAGSSQQARAAASLSGRVSAT
jgi:hypothetical protein